MAFANRRPQISVIIPAYNCEATIRKAVSSALGQSIRAIELIIADDGSQDRTPQIVTELARADDRIIPIVLPDNVGVGAARNSALARASGAWVAMLDADDWFQPDRLRTMLAAAEQLDADLVCDNLRLFDHALGYVVGVTQFGARRHATPITVRRMFELDHALRRHNLGFTKPMVRTAFLKREGITYDPRFRVGEDFLFLAEALLHGARAFILPSADYIYIHRIAPSTRTVAPNSRAGTGFSDICRSCAHLLGRYWRGMSRLERRALAQKRKSISDWLAYMDVLTALRNKNFREVIAILKRRPTVPLIKIYTTRNRILDLMMIGHARMRRYWTALGPNKGSVSD
ncbi:MAG: glycosyltransferase family 2 protein [Stellaceae bacterium]